MSDDPVDQIPDDMAFEDAMAELEWIAWSRARRGWTRPSACSVAAPRCRPGAKRASIPSVRRSRN